MDELGIKVAASSAIATPANTSTIAAAVAASASASNISSSTQDLYMRLKKLQRHLEFLLLQEEYIKDEQKNLKSELIRAKEEASAL